MIRFENLSLGYGQRTLIDSLTGEVQGGHLTALVGRNGTGKSTLLRAIARLGDISSGDILLNGHTHVPACRDCGDFLYINPGSVSIPKENSAHSYMILEGGNLTWKDLDGNVYMEHALK